jgi:DnaJ-class molecular chaperone
MVESNNELIDGLTRTHRNNVVCPYCKGKGTIEQRKFYGHTEGWMPSYHRCGVCDGTKVLERIVRIEYRKI